MRPKYEIVLKALSQGQEIDFEDYKISLKREENGKLVLCFKCTVYSDRETEPRTEYHRFPMGLDRFLNWCESLSEDDMFIIGANNFLNEGKEV